jgi:cyanobactin cluster PatC/TenC/TruC protein
MSPESREPDVPPAPKSPRADTEKARRAQGKAAEPATERQPAAAASAAPVDAPATRAEAMAIKPASAFPLQVPLETGLSDYGMWCELLGQTEHPPLPTGERRGRIWG